MNGSMVMDTDYLLELIEINKNGLIRKIYAQTAEKYSMADIGVSIDGEVCLYTFYKYVFRKTEIQLRQYANKNEIINIVQRDTAAAILANRNRFMRFVLGADKLTNDMKITSSDLLLNARRELGDIELSEVNQELSLCDFSKFPGKSSYSNKSAIIIVHLKRRGYLNLFDNATERFSFSAAITVNLLAPHPLSPLMNSLSKLGELKRLAYSAKSVNCKNVNVVLSDYVDVLNKGQQ